MTLDQIANAFVTLLVIVEPVAVVPLFLALTEGFDAAQRRQTALRRGKPRGSRAGREAMEPMMAWKGFPRGIADGNRGGARFSADNIRRARSFAWTRRFPPSPLMGIPNATA